MKQKLVLITSLCFFLIALYQPAHAQADVSVPDVAMDLQWKIGQWHPLWQTQQFNSKTVGQDVGYYVYLPPGYQENKTQRYPLLIWLHGAYGRPHSATPVVRRLDTAIRAGKAPPMIVVSCLDPTGLSMWTDAKDGRLPMETLIIKELIPHLDDTYRTLASRKGRAVEGFSMGGYGAAYLGFKYADHFSSVSMLAAALHTPETFRDRRRAIFDNVFGGDHDYASDRSPWHWARANSEKIKDKTTVRIFVGAKDGLLTWNDQYHQLLDSLGISHEWGVVPDSPHDLEVVMQNWQGDFFAYYNALFAE